MGRDGYLFLLSGSYRLPRRLSPIALGAPSGNLEEMNKLQSNHLTSLATRGHFIFTRYTISVLSANWNCAGLRPTSVAAGPA
jgi:hypothetical protein